jgi:hypothetical protein
MKATRAGVRRSDQVEVEDEGDVFTTVTEAEYKKMVQERRAADDFVVDDEGLGYYDDGEEHLFDAVGGGPARRKGDVSAAPTRAWMSPYVALALRLPLTSLPSPMLSLSRSLASFRPARSAAHSPARSSSASASSTPPRRAASGRSRACSSRRAREATP